MVSNYFGARVVNLWAPAQLSTQCCIKSHFLGLEKDLVLVLVILKWLKPDRRRFLSHPFLSFPPFTFFSFPSYHLFMFFQCHCCSPEIIYVGVLWIKCANPLSRPLMSYTAGLRNEQRVHLPRGLHKRGPQHPHILWQKCHHDCLSFVCAETLHFLRTFSVMLTAVRLTNSLYRYFVNCAEKIKSFWDSFCFFSHIQVQPGSPRRGVRG